MPIAIKKDFVVNSTKAGTSSESAVNAVLFSGNILVTWTVQTVEGNNLVNKIQGRLFDLNGKSLGNDFAVSSSTSKIQTASSVTNLFRLSDDRFLVTWTSDDTRRDANGSPLDDQFINIRARLFGSDGRPLGADFVVHNDKDFNQFDSSAHQLPNGKFVVTWTNGSTTVAGSSPDIFIRLFDENGTPSAPEVRVNTTVEFPQNVSRVTHFDDGGFAVFFMSNERTGADPNGCIRARLFDASGVPQGDDFIVNSTTSKRQSFVEVASQDDTLLAVWQSEDTVDSDKSFGAIRGRFIGPDGADPVGDFVINTVTSNQQTGPKVAALDDGRFVVAWTSFDTEGPDKQASCIRAKVLDATGIPAGDEFVINTTFKGNQTLDSISALRGGRFAVTFTSTDASTATVVDFNVRMTIADATVFNGTAGADSWVGGSLGDTMKGKAGKDAFIGEAGNDKLFGDSGNDLLLGGAGNDVLIGGAGSDRIDGNTGVDTASYSAEAAAILALDGSFAKGGSAAGDRLTSIENISGSNTGSDRLAGNSIANALSGNGGNDKLFGKGGNDKLSGGNGNDVLDGGTGADRLTGGAGVDRFFYGALNSGGDAIVDFDGRDLFVFKGSVFGGFVAGKIDGSRFEAHAGNGALNASTRFVRDISDNSLWFDADGSGTSAAIKIADLSTAFVFGADHILIV